MTVFTMVTEATNEIALPFNTVSVALPAVEKVTPDDAMMLPTMVPPPAPLITAALPTYQYTFLGCPPLIMVTVRAPAGPAAPTVSPAAVWNIQVAFGSPCASSTRSRLVILNVPLADLYSN